MVSVEQIQLPFRLMLGEELLCKGTQVDEKGDEFAEFDGIVSTEHPDVQGDIIVQKGVDWDHFRKNGVFDWEHGKEPDDIIGVPLEVREHVICKGIPGTYVRGKLLLKQPKAQKAYELMKSLSGSGRQMGFSVLGKGMRDPFDKRKIIKSLFSRVAFTVTPVNPFTGGGLVHIVKALDDLSDAPPALSSQLTQQQFRELVRQSWGSVSHLDVSAIADTLYRRAQLDAGRTRA